MPLWLEYRPDKFFFRGGARLTFPVSSRLGYSPDTNLVALELSQSFRRIIEAEFPFEANGLFLPELKEIQYSMLIDLPQGKQTVPFSHKLDVGANVHLVRNEDNEFLFGNIEGRRMFTKDRTVYDVTLGDIDSDRIVWQFHGRNHEG